MAKLDLNTQVADFSRAASAQVASRLSVEPDPQCPGAQRIWLHALQAIHPGQGAGTDFMADLCALADRNSVAIDLTAATSLDQDLSRLVSWYARFGFQVEATISDPVEVALRREPS